MQLSDLRPIGTKSASDVASRLGDEITGFTDDEPPMHGELEEDPFAHSTSTAINSLFDWVKWWGASIGSGKRLTWH